MRFSVLSSIKFLFATLNRCFSSPRSHFFLLLFLAYCHLPVYLYGVLHYEPYPPIQDATLRSAAFAPFDATVVLTTISVNASENPDYAECLTSWLKIEPARLVVVTDTSQRADAAELHYKEITESLRHSAPDASRVPGTHISAGVADKRAQIVAGLRVVRTPITVFVDDHTFPNPDFLHDVLPVFADPRVGLCGTVKQVRRNYDGGYWANFANIISIAYLEQYNLELCGTTTLDWGMRVVSGRAMVVVTELLQRTDFYENFMHEDVIWPSIRAFLCRLGIRVPAYVKIGDDNFITQWVVKLGYRLRFLHTKGALVETTIVRSLSLLIFKSLRWLRTTIRYNPILLSKRLVWEIWPWSVWVAYVRPLVDVHVVMDLAIQHLFKKTDLYNPQRSACLALFQYFSKDVELLPHLSRHPDDFYYAIVYPLWVYLRNFIHLYAVLTFWVQDWAGGTHSLKAVGMHTEIS